MTLSINHRFRKLRSSLDIRPYRYDGQMYFFLRDNLELSDKQLAVPQALGPVLFLADGTRDIPRIEAELLVQYGLRLPGGALEQLFSELDEAFLLDNDNYQQAKADALRAYRRQPYRTPALAGSSYPADPNELRRWLDGYLETAEAVRPAPATGRGLLSPHIDYMRGGPVYAGVWKRAAEMAKAADLVVLLGTDHFSDELGSVTLTRQHYATPFGVLPTALDVVDQLEAALGQDAAYRGELRHRGEHSLELVAIWLHYMRGEQPVELVPILTGSFQSFVEAGRSPGDDPQLSSLIEALKTATAGRNVLVVASGDLSHVGLAFGGKPLDQTAKDELRLEDDRVSDQMRAGNAEGFYSVVQSTRDRNNVCGLSPVYLMLKLLGDARGDTIGYAMCPADEQETSVVTVSGVVFE
jgi:hypothetical protein